VQVRRYEMGVRAAEMVIQRLEGEPFEQLIVDMGYEIKKRQSTSR
jgi:LacI family gluconate utilization system Gnt-I transcriptional repressor